MDLQQPLPALPPLAPLALTDQGEQGQAQVQKKKKPCRVVRKRPAASIHDDGVKKDAEIESEHSPRAADIDDDDDDEKVISDDDDKTVHKKPAAAMPKKKGPIQDESI